MIRATAQQVHIGHWSSSGCQPDRISELPFAERLMIWATHLWVRGRRQRTSVQSHLIQGLSRAREAFDA